MVRERFGKMLRSQEPKAARVNAPQRRTDVRLALPALLVWSAAIAGVWLTPAALVALCCGLALVAVLLVASGARGRRSLLMTSSVALMLAVAAAAHSAVSSSQRHDGPFAEAVSSGKSVVAVLEVAGSPRSVSPSGHAGMPDRWSATVVTVEVIADGNVIHAGAQLLVMGGGAWGELVPGQVVRATGKLKPSDAGQTEAGVLAASAPMILSGASGWQAGAKDLRGGYVAASSFLAPDARGLLPGMVTGDTSALDEGLNAAMKSVGMTHLTAVSGANCSLVLGALLLAARSLRLPRVPAAALALGGLGLFVLMVGPDASVLRAALMGSIALGSLAGGRSGRGLSFLCLAVIGLLLYDPGLGTSFGFLLSVLATLGIIVLGQRMVDWTPAVVPRWVAAAFAVPLSAQLLCGPVIVLLQPQFSAYSLLANVVAAPLVAPVTLLGTAAVPLVVLAPWAAVVLIAVAGTFSAGVAGVARFMAALPGASLPWTEGVYGLLTMVLLSALTLVVVRMALRPRQSLDLAQGLHRRIEEFLMLAERHILGYRAGRRPRARHGFVPRVGRGRLGYRTNTSRRNAEWPLRQPRETGHLRPTLPTPPPGGT
ncbi:ComEC/Rec2 family competence protein [Arthrobacter sp. ISL-48]|nr:ComEC/Rec2 family competence protein [Arthrobacter sp. ISL-48]